MASDAELKVIITAIDKFSKNLDAISAKLTTANRSAKQTATGVAGLNQRMVAFTRNAQKMVGGLVAIAIATQGMRRAISSTIGLAIDFESSFAGIRKTMDATEAEFKALERANRELAKSLPLSINEINKLGELAGQFGIRGISNIVLFEEAIAGLGIATNLTAEEAATAMARIASVTQTPISQIDNLASVVVELGNNFATTEAEILLFAQRIAGTATALGFTADQILGIGAAFTAVGVPAERGGTAIQKVLIAMQSAALGAKDELEDFTTVLGITDETFRSLARTDPGALLIRFIEALSAAGELAIPILEGLDLADQRLLASLLSAAGGQDILRRAMEAAGVEVKENTALTEEVGKRTATTASQLQLAANNWADLGISIGQKALPAIRAGAAASIVLTDTLSELGSRLDLVALGVIALTIPFTGPVGLIAALGFLAFRWREVFQQLPGPVQTATIAVAGFVDQMVNAVLTGLDKIIDGINKFTGLLNKIKGIDIAQIGGIGFRSNIAGGLAGAITPAGLTRQELARLGEQQIKEFLAGAQVLISPGAFGGVPAPDPEKLSAAKKVLTLADALADGIIELAEAMELGLSITDAARLELAANEVAQAEAAFRAQVEFEKLKRVLGPLGLIGQIDVFAFAMSELGQEFRRGGESVVQFINRLADAAKDALRTTFSDLFGRPTREQATLERDIAILRRQRALLFLGGSTADELEPLLTPLDAQIAAIENLLDVRSEERNIQRSLFDLADQTLLTDQQQLTELRFIRAAMEQFTTGLAQTSIQVNVEGAGLTAQQIGDEVSRRTQDELRLAGFGGSLIGSGTFVPG